MICNTFGVAKLKAFQKDVITDLLNGKDVLGLARTSEGKSICFLSMVAMHPNELLIGILPTVALMRDLVQRCEDSKKYEWAACTAAMRRIAILSKD